MASKSPRFDEMSERCEDCERTTTHHVTVELKTESTKPENAQFSREPYRVSECTSCGSVRTQRMNNA